MSFSPLTAISPIDGRYFEKTRALSAFFSEFGLIYHRVVVEVRWLESLADNPQMQDVPRLSVKAKHILDNILKNFSEADAAHIKHLESQTQHDVKAVEYFLKEKFQTHPELSVLSEFIHFACTSEDINNIAYGLMIHSARKQIIKPLLEDVLSILKEQVTLHADLPMLSRTHGQPASATTVGKEFSNFAFRLTTQVQDFFALPIKGKVNGAVGNYNAHYCAYPEVDWLAHSQNFVESLGLTWNPYTTQIEPHDYIAEIAHNMIRIHTILINFARDVWGYISLNYFKQKVSPGEVGSSTMPHKVNPIDFENAEGNLGIANALWGYFGQQLAVSRWQRDLTDSTLLRNLGTAFAHSIIAYQAIKRGVLKLEPNPEALNQDLENHWEVLGEAVQTVMRRYGEDSPYEKLKELTRGKKIDKNALHNFIQTLSLPSDVKAQLLALTPQNYNGIASQLAKELNTHVSIAIS